MSKKEKKIKGTELQADIHLDIPEDEIWTYQVEGLAPPHINKPYKHYTLKKIVLALVIIVAVSLSMYFSVRTVQSDVFEYSQAESGYQFDKFSNTGYITELDINYISSIEYDNQNNDPATNFIIKNDEAKKVTAIREYAFNCDGTIKVINIGPDVLSIDGKSFYSCWSLERIEVDENNPNYCDVDGVLYNKDMTEVICYPCNHDEYLRQKYGYEKELYKDEVTPEYERDIQTYVVPASVEKIDEMCFNYANLRVIYLPEGLKRVETLAIFKLHERVDQWGTTPSLTNVYSYKSDKVTSTHFTSEKALGEIYNSLPEGLEFIGSDAFSYNQALSYVYIPESVTYVGHHAFWDTVYKADGELKGVTEIYVACSEEEFNNLEIGDDWKPKYDYLLFKKAVETVYNSDRK